MIALLNSRMCWLLLLWLGLCACSSPAHAAVVLNDDAWSIRIVPETLAITATPAGSPAVPLSVGVEARTVHGLQQTGQRASWRWGAAGDQVHVRLQGDDLWLEISAAHAGTMPLLRQPAAAMGQALLLPLAEGARIPANDPLWRAFLLEKMDRFNTTQDISLPLWSVLYGSHSLSWILAEQFDNTMGFEGDGKGVAMTLQHSFSDAQPMTLLLHLGSADPLAGAKRYKRLLIDQGRYETLAQKQRNLPQVGKLAGALHVYLWGDGVLARRDVRDWPALLKVLKQPDGLPAQLRAAFDEEANTVLKQVGARPDRYQQRVLIAAINASLDARVRQHWQTAVPDMRAMVTAPAALRSEVAATFSEALTTEPAQWGGGVSVQTMRRLKAAGLDHLWIGLGSGWEGGVWHPEAVQAAVDAGYLVAPYDSYQTATRASAASTWSTTQLGEQVYRDCAITMVGGGVQAGFQSTGRYTRPDCVRPALQQRINALRAAVPFNSWFLDAYATGMVFRSVAPGVSMSQALNAAGNIASMRWVGEDAGMVVGSEDGNAVTSQGVVFAHGMQTPVIGWGDPRMHTQRDSPYYVGRWYPGWQPQVFFRQVPVAEPYRSVHFAPAYRLPLYPAVFHGSVITSHHWLYDSLKLSNVQVENTLMQLLYNVPPLYHLSEETLAQRLPLMQQQAAFFTPLHQRLATQALVEFSWLDQRGQVQQTRFADGTRLLANFGRTAFAEGALTLPAQSVMAIVPGQTQHPVFSMGPAAGP